jgi:hypothetical protein
VIFFFIPIRIFIAIAKRIFGAIVERKSHQIKGATWEINSFFG